MSSKFHIEMCGDVDLEGMAIYISYDTEIIASITYEKGINNMEIELFPLEDFFVFLEKAKKLAIKCAQEDGL